jgi:hypothetical protein
MEVRPMVGSKGKMRILAMIQDYMARYGAASARELASYVSMVVARGVTTAQVSNFLAADRRFRKAKRIRIKSGVRGGAIWLWELN